MAVDVNTTSDAHEALVNQGRTDSQTDALLNAKQTTLSYNSGCTGEALLTRSTLRKTTARSNVSFFLQQIEI